MTQSPIDPDSAPYRPAGAALALFYCKDQEILIDGPAGTGKSRSALEKVHLVMQKYPRARGLLVRKTRASMTESTLVTFEEKVLPAGDPMKAGQARSHRHSYDYGNGSSLITGGMDNVTKIMSTEYDIIMVDEATELTEGEHESLISRLRNHVVPFQQIIDACNPDAPNHWLIQRASRGQMTRIASRHIDNPAYHDGTTWTPQGEQYMATLAAMTGVRRLRLLEGVWAAAEGIIYDEFDHRIHVITKACDVSDFKELFASIDFGFVHAGVLQVWAVDEDGRIYLVREVFTTKKTIDFWIERCVEVQNELGVDVFVCDSARPDYIAQLQAVGLNAIQAYKSVDVGINAVKQRLVVQADGLPRLFILDDCLTDPDPALIEAKKPCRTADEFACYTWKPGKDEPVKVNDDGMDAMRYAVAYIDNLATEGVTMA